MAWRVELFKTAESGYCLGRCFDYFDVPTYKDACTCAKMCLDDECQEAAIFKVGGVPLRHHIDHTKTTIYNWNKGKPYRWFW